MNSAFNLVTIQDDYDLGKIVSSGQCFRAKVLPDNLFRFVTGKSILYIRKKSFNEYAISCSKSEWKKTWVPYFDLNRNYGAIRSRIPVDDIFMRKAADEGTGIRILRQEPFEMLISFIISQRKSIPAIKSSIEAIAQRYGEYAETHYESLYLFPTIDQLSEADSLSLQQCKIGYRVPYVLSAISMISSNRISIPDLASLSDRDLCQKLKTIHGVGDKVANCVALFAFGRTSVVPIDTWIKQLIYSEYTGTDPFPNYGETAGIMQQYAFYYALNHKKEIYANA